MIGIALACEPRLLIADEPTTALDVTIQDQILALLDELKERLGMAVLLITHDMGVIAGRADRVLVMYAGKIVEAAATAEVFRRTRHPYTAALLASIPRLDQPVSQQLYTISGLPPDLANPPAGCRFAPRCRFAADDCTAREPAWAGRTRLTRTRASTRSGRTRPCRALRSQGSAGRKTPPPPLSCWSWTIR